MSLYTVGLALVVVFIIVNWLIAIDARLRGTISKANPFARLFDAVNVKVLKLVGVATEAATDHVAAADVNIATRQRDLESFSDSIEELRTELILKRKDLPAAEAKVKKWEKIYLAATDANDKDGADEASRKLKNADTKLAGLNDVINSIEESLVVLEADKDKLRSQLDDAELNKDYLTADNIAADLKLKAKQNRDRAFENSDGLGDFREAVARKKAKVEAINQSNDDEDSLVNKYTVDTSHEDRLAALRGK